MAPTPNLFWREVKAQTIAGTLVVVAASTLGGIAYLIHRVPSQLDRVLENQTQFGKRLDKQEAELDNVERDYGPRIVRLEAKQ